MEPRAFTNAKRRHLCDGQSNASGQISAYLPFAYRKLQMLYERLGFETGRQAFTVQTFCDVVMSALTGYRDPRTDTFASLNRFGDRDWPDDIDDVETEIRGAFNYKLFDGEIQQRIRSVKCSALGEVAVSYDPILPEPISLSRIFRQAGLHEDSGMTLANVTFDFDIGPMFQDTPQDHFALMESHGHFLEDYLRYTFYLCVGTSYGSITQEEVEDFSWLSMEEVDVATLRAVPEADGFMLSEVRNAFTRIILKIATRYYWTFQLVLQEAMRQVTVFDSDTMVFNVENVQLSDLGGLVRVDFVIREGTQHVRYF